MQPFHLYILRCSDGSYYVGHTDDLDVRIAQHQSGELPGYTSTRLPVELVFATDFPSRDDALQREFQVRGWSRAKKEALIRGDWTALQALSRNRQGRGTPLTEPSLRRRCPFVVRLSLSKLVLSLSKGVTTNGLSRTAGERRPRASASVPRGTSGSRSPLSLSKGERYGSELPTNTAGSERSAVRGSTGSPRTDSGWIIASGNAARRRSTFHVEHLVPFALSLSKGGPTFGTPDQHRWVRRLGRPWFDRLTTNGL
jgi:putative endonuclease